MRASPSAKPIIEAPSETPLTPAAAKPSPMPAIAAVSEFRMRRDRMSTAVATSAPDASTAPSRHPRRACELASDVDEKGAHGETGGRDRANRDEGDPRYEQGVVGQGVAPVLPSERLHRGNQLKRVILADAAPFFAVRVAA